MPDAKSSTSPAVRYEPIPLFPGYRIGSDGSVWSCLKRVCRGYGGGSSTILTDEWHRRKPFLHDDGYRVVILRRGHGKRPGTRYVHHLVLEAFVGPCPPGLECRHLDGDPGNNRLENLCWGTPKENQGDRVRHGTSNRGEAHGCAVMTEGGVREAREMHAGGQPICSLARQFGVSHSTMALILHGVTWQHVPTEDK